MHRQGEDEAAFADPNSAPYGHGSDIRVAQHREEQNHEASLSGPTNNNDIVNSSALQTTPEVEAESWAHWATRQVYNGSIYLVSGLYSAVMVTWRFEKPDETVVSGVQNTYWKAPATAEPSASVVPVTGSNPFSREV